MKEINNASDQLKSILFYGYPNKTIQKLGVTNVQEAITATQFAIWRIAETSGNSRKGDMIFDMSNIQPSECEAKKHP